ncbi:MAG: LysR family transcriptional regulator [Roseovarius sp.]|jgi:DNA-binding transcriptional LysR family regulator|uniref:LysR family transcriptional regulator n=1 Tax=Roseovarius sp. TaxID=1486281 RepID=UPI0032EC9B1E
MRINFDFADLEAFLVLSETGSFVVAAAHLGVSQSALTRRIRKLEETLGAQLFDRTTRSVRMTLAAKRLRSRAQGLVDEARETMREMKDDTAEFSFQNRAIVTVAAVPSTIARVVIPAVGLFSAGRNEARVRILDLLANEVAEAVEDGQADFGVSSWAAPDGALLFEPFFEDRVVLVVPPDHPLAQASGALKWGALSGQRLILPSQGSGNRALIDRALAPEALSLFWSYEVPRTSTALELVRAGLGVAALPLSAVPVADGSRLAIRPLSSPAVARRIGLVYRRNGAIPPAAARLRDLIVPEAHRWAEV